MGFVHLCLCYQTIEVEMSDFNWCHGPRCHTNHTVDRVRGSKGNKVLRTRKVTINESTNFINWGFVYG